MPQVSLSALTEQKRRELAALDTAPVSARASERYRGYIRFLDEYVVRYRENAGAESEVES